MARQSNTVPVTTSRRALPTRNAPCLINPVNVSIPEFDHKTVSDEYGFYCVPTEFQGREVPKLLSAGEVYEPKTLALMRRIAGAGDIVSGGGFIGDFFPALSEALSPGAVLHSFEPNPISHSAALRTIALNRLKNVSMSMMAVGETEAALPLRVSRGNDDPMAARARIVEGASDAGTIDVQVTTLDSLIDASRDVTVLHLDIEGHELPALKGAQALISRCKPVIILEAARPHMRRMYKAALCNMFPELKYEIVGRIERNCIYRASEL